MSNTFSAFVEDFHSHMTRDPNDCVLLGVEKRLNDLPDPSLDQLDDEVAEARALVDRAKGMDRSKLDFDQALDLDLAALQLESDIYQDRLTFNDRLTPQQMPEAGSEISEGIFMMYINDPRPDEERLANIEARLAKVPDYLDALIHRLDTPVRRWVQIDLDEVAGLPELFPDLQAWADRIGWSDAGRLRQTQATATSALQSYATQLGAMPTTDHFHLTEEAARSIVSLAGIEPSLEDIHHMAVEFLADTGEGIEELRERLCVKYGLDSATTTDALQLYLNKRFAVSEPGSPLSRILDRYKQEQERVLAFVNQHALFPMPEDQDR